MNTSPIHFRAATEADIPALRALIEASVRGLQTNEHSQAQIDGALGNALGLDTQLVADRTYFIAEDADGSLLGSGGWSYRRTLFGADGANVRESNLLDPKTEAARIRAIFVAPEHARKGVGSAILEHCEDAARAAGFTRAEMGSTLTGLPLYTLKGYVAQKTVEVPLPNGAVLPVIHMTKILSSKHKGLA